MKAGAAGGIEAVIKAINTHIGCAAIHFVGAGLLWNISFASTKLQREVCEKGGLNVLLRVLKSHPADEYLLGSCCSGISLVLSSPETYSKFCTPDVIRAVGECYEKHKDSEQIKQSLFSLKREEDPRVRDAVARGACTKEAFPKCNEDCSSDMGSYCLKCCVQQKVFRCLTCDKDKIRLYCEVCWQRDHQGHKGEEFFCPVRCATGHK